VSARLGLRAVRSVVHPPRQHGSAGNNLRCQYRTAAGLRPVDAADHARASHQPSERREHRADRYEYPSYLGLCLGRRGSREDIGHLLGLDGKEGAGVLTPPEAAAAFDAHRQRHRKVIVDHAVKLAQATQLRDQKCRHALDRCGASLRVVHKLLDNDTASGTHESPQEQPGREDGQKRRKGEPVADLRRAFDSEKPRETKVRQAVDTELHQDRQECQCEEHRSHPEDDRNPTGREPTLEFPYDSGGVAAPRPNPHAEQRPGDHERCGKFVQGNPDPSLTTVSRSPTGLEAPPLASSWADDAVARRRFVPQVLEFRPARAYSSAHA
jgi:hypothetical protein